MKKIMLVFVFGFSLIMISCSSQRTTYDISNFIYAMNEFDSDWRIDFINDDGDDIRFNTSSRKLTLNETETLYIISYYTNEDVWITDYENFESYFQCDIDAENVGSPYIYLVLIDDPDSEQNTVRYPSYKELCRIFKDYMDEHPMPTSNYCRCNCD